MSFVRFTKDYMNPKQLRESRMMFIPSNMMQHVFIIVDIDLRRCTFCGLN